MTNSLLTLVIFPREKRVKIECHVMSMRIKGLWELMSRLGIKEKEGWEIEFDLSATCIIYNVQGEVDLSQYQITKVSTEQIIVEKKDD